MVQLRSKKLWALVLSALMLSGALFGCGSNTTPSGGSADTSTDAPATSEAESAAPSGGSTDSDVIELFSQKTEDVAIYDEILADFMEEYPDIKIVQTTTAGGTTFVARVASNDLPDIGGVYYQSTYHAMMDEGLFVDQTGEAYLDRINDTVVDMMKWDGKVYVLPVTLNGFGLYYNKDIYAEYDLEVPTTVEQLMANCEVLVENGVTPFCFPFKNTGSLGQLFERSLNGGVTTDTVKISEELAAGDGSFGDYPEIVSFLENWYKLGSEYTGVDPLSLDTDDVARLFANQEVAMILNGTWGCSVYDELNPDLNYEMVLVPSFSGMTPNSSGTVDIALTISSGSKYIEECKTFFEYFTRDEVAQKFAEADKNPSAVKAVSYEIPHMTAISQAIANNQFSLIPSTYWPAGYRDEIQIELQQLQLDGDVPAFISSWDRINDDFYNNNY